jgi:hypothetical protein
MGVQLAMRLIDPFSGIHSHLKRSRYAGRSCHQIRTRIYLVRIQIIERLIKHAVEGEPQFWADSLARGARC